MSTGKIAALRKAFQTQLINGNVLALRPTVPDGPTVVNIADTNNAASRAVSVLLAHEICMGTGINHLNPAAPRVDPGKLLEMHLRDYLEQALALLPSTIHRWSVHLGGAISNSAQYHHLQELQILTERFEELRLTLGGDYLIRPDIVVLRAPIEDTAFGEGVIGAGDSVARLTFLRRANQDLPLLQASVSCKWTMRSDRAQNARTEALNLIRNRKGRVPAIAVVTIEPMPSRLASLAEGTGDVDRVYHVALYELEAAITAYAQENQRVAGAWHADLDRLVRGKRLADISDLPFDLVT